MLSFQEWKDKKLQELALEEKAKILEGKFNSQQTRLKSFGLRVRAAKPSETRVVHQSGHPSSTNVVYCCLTSVTRQILMKVWRQ